MVVAFLTVYLTRNFGFSVAKAGFVMGLFGAGAIAAGYIGGRLTDKFGFYPIQLITLSGGGLMFILLGMMKSYASICITTFFLGLVNESFRPANATAIAHYSTPANRTRSYSLNRLAINIGWALGGSMGGILATIDYQLLFWVDGITNMLGAVLLWFLIRPSHTNKTTGRDSHHTAIVSAYRDRTYLLFILFTTCFAMCFFQMFTSLPMFLNQDLGFGEMFIGFLMGLNGVIIGLVEMILVNRLEGRRRNLSYIFIGVSLCSLSFFMYNIFPGGKLLAVSAMIVITFGEILSMPFMNSFWISRSTATNRGQYAGLYTMAWATAQVIGPVFGAQLAQHYGFNFLWWVIGSLCVAAAAGFLYMHRIVQRT